jgi:ABC-type multidrug transport system fused ATPase/permease subunit
MRKLIDLEAIAKTDWAKASLEKKPAAFLIFAGLVTVLVSLFTPYWLEAKFFCGGEMIEAQRIDGYTTTQGIFILILLVFAAYGLFYQQYGVVTVASLIICVLAAVYHAWAETFTLELTINGETKTVDEFRSDLYNLGELVGETTGMRYEAYGSMVAMVGSMVSLFFSFIMFKKSK